MLGFYVNYHARMRTDPDFVAQQLQRSIKLLEWRTMSIAAIAELADPVTQSICNREDGTEKFKSAVATVKARMEAGLEAPPPTGVANVARIMLQAGELGALVRWLAKIGHTPSLGRPHLDGEASAPSAADGL